MVCWIKLSELWKQKDYEVVLCNDGFLYINKDDGNDAISKDSKCLSEKDLEEIKSWIDKNHEYVRTDAFIEKACEYIITHIPDLHTLGISAKMDEFIIKEFRKYMKGE